MTESDEVRVAEPVVVVSVADGAELVMVALAVSVAEETESVLVTDAENVTEESVVEALGSADAVELEEAVAVESTVDDATVVEVAVPPGGTEVSPVDPLLVGFIVIVHFLTSSTAGWPSCPTTGVSVMTHVSVIKPATLGKY